jgi:tetratricopeptide (TPR) repeat protein
LKASGDSEGLKEDLLTIFGFSQTLDVSERMLKVFCENIQPWDTLEAMRSSPGAFLAAHLGAWNTGTFGELLAEFSSLFLIQSYYRGDDGFYHASLHPLVKDWVVLRTSKEKAWDYRLLAVEIFVEAINPSVAGEDQTNLAPVSLDYSPDTGAASLEHVERDLESNIANDPEHLKALLESQTAFASLLKGNGEYRRAERISRRLVPLYEKCYGNTNLHTIKAQHLLAVILRFNGQDHECESICSRIVPLVIRGQGFDRDLSKETTRVWALALMKLGRREEAMSLLQRIAESEKRVIGHIERVTAINISNLLYCQKKYVECLEMCDNAMSPTLGDMSSEDPRLLTSCRVLSVFCFVGLGNWEKVVKIAQGVWQEQVKFWGDQHPTTNVTLLSLGRALSKLGDFEEAERLLKKARDNLLLTVRMNHPHFLGAQRYLGWTMWCQGRLEEAESYYRSTTDGLRGANGFDNEIESAVAALACVLRDSGAAHVARYEIAKWLSSLDKQNMEPQAPFWDEVEELTQNILSKDMKGF